MSTPVQETRRDLSVDARLVEDARGGDQLAFGRLYDGWSDRAYDHSYGILRNPDTAAEVVQDAFFTAWRRLDDLRDGAAFGGWLLQITRNRALNRLRAQKRSHPVDAEQLAAIEATAGSPAGGPAGFGIEDRLSTFDDPQRAAEDAELTNLVWDAALALSERDVSVLDLHLRLGYDPAAIARQMGVTRNSANQILHRVRDRLGNAIGARVLWRHGEPLCHALSRSLRAARCSEFNAETAKVITAHAENCDQCESRRRTRLSPATLFSIIPATGIPVALRSKAAAALEQGGVPMQGSISAHSFGTGVSGGSGAGGAGGTGGSGSGGGGTGGGAAVNGRSGGMPRKVLAVSAASGVAAVLVAAVVALWVFGSTRHVAAARVTEGVLGNLTTGPLATNEPVEPDETMPTTSGPTRSTTTTTTTTQTTPHIESVQINPSRVPAGYPLESYYTKTEGDVSANPPVLTWNVADGTGSVRVAGAGVSSTAFSGSKTLCPGPISGSTCQAKAGSYAVTVTVYDINGDEVDSQSATLHIT